MARERSRGSFWLPLASLWVRELVRFYKKRSRVIGALGPPVLAWWLIGSGLGTSFQADGAGGASGAGARPGAEAAGFLVYFFPGTLVLILLFTAIFSTISVIEERREGFLQAVLVAPVSRTSVVLAKILGGSSLAVAQGALFLLAAPAIGIALTPIGFLAELLVLFAVAFWLTGVGLAIAWRLDSTQGFHGIMNLVLIPMWMLSGALFPASGATGWVRWIMHVNPLTYGVAAVRLGLGDAASGGVAAGPGAPTLTASLLVTGACGLVALAVATLLVAHRSGRGEGGVWA